MNVVMFSVDCCRRCARIAKAFPAKDFLVLCKECNDNKEIQQQWDMASDLLDGLAEDPVDNFSIPTGCYMEQRSGIRLESSFWFVTVPEFIRSFKLDPKAAGLKILSLTDEEGVRPLKGVIVQPQDGDPPHLYRRVTVFNETTWFVQETHLDAKRRLRVPEPSELFAEMNKNNSETRHEDCIDQQPATLLGMYLLLGFTRP